MRPRRVRNPIKATAREPINRPDTYERFPKSCQILDCEQQPTHTSGPELLCAFREAIADDFDFVLEVPTTIDKRCFVPGVLALSICAEPIERASAKKVFVDRYNLTVKLR